MSYIGWGRQQPFWGYQDRPIEQNDVWLGKKTKNQVQDCGTTQQLPQE